MHFPTLERVVSLLESEKGNSLCFHRSAALCFDLPGSVLVMGTFDPARQSGTFTTPPADASKVPFIHAWVEWKGKVIAPTTLEHFGHLQPMLKLSYYKANAAHNMRRLSRSALLEIFKREPELLLELQTGKRPSRDGMLVDNLLAAAKLAYKLSEDNGVIPA